MALGYHREVSIKFDIRSVGIFDVVSARLGDGEVFDSAKLKNTVRFLIENDMRNVVIDLGNLEYLYSDTINAFIASNRHMLEVSGRIAILTEHPKVQDILKRAGLDNIMRIYRSEAEMIADSKEILRQTSSYRIEELQKISTQPPQEAPPAIRTEFDDFKMEMGQRLGSKLDNNEVPQYQLGVSQNTAPAPAGFTATPPTRETANPYPSFNQPGFTVPPAPETVPSQGQPGYVPSQPAPAFGNFNNAPAYGLNNNGAPAYGGQQAQGFGAGPMSAPTTPANFDFPTVQLPVGAFGGTTQPISAPSGPSAPTAPPGQGFPPQDSNNDLDPRSRKSSQERMRSPNARRQQGRRVGGREFPGGMEDSQEMQAYAEERAPEAQAPAEQFGAYSVPPSSPNTLVEESRSPFKLIVFLMVLAGIVAGLYFYMKQEPLETTEAIPQGVPSVPEQPSEVVTPPSAEAVPPTNAPVTPSVTPPVPATPEVAAVKPPAAKSPVAEAPKAEPAKPKPEPEKVAVRTPPAAVKKPKAPAVERPARSPAPAPDNSPAPSAAGPGKLRITSEPPGAEVLVNFSKKGTTPLEISLLNNSNKIIVRLPGYKRFEVTLPKNHPDRELDVSLDREEGVAESRPEPASKPKAPEKPAPNYSGDDEDPEDLPMAKPERRPDPPRVEAQRPKPEAAPAPGDGPIGVIFLSSSPARADIIIDGKSTGKKTPAKVELPSGPHRIEMVKSGQRSVIDQQVNEGKNKALHLTLQ